MPYEPPAIFDPNPDPGNAVAATGEYLLGSLPTAGQTLIIGAVTYTFRASASIANEIEIGTDAADTVGVLAVAISDGADESGRIGAGTVAHPTVEANNDTATLELTARTPGAAGNSIAVSGTAPFTGPATLTGGADAFLVPPVNVFTPPSGIPQFLRITGITSPAASDPLILARVADVGGFPHWQDSTGLWEMDSDADGFALAKSGSAYLAFIGSALKSPVGLTGWTVGPGTGQPSVAAHLPAPPAIFS